MLRNKKKRQSHEIQNNNNNKAAGKDDLVASNTPQNKMKRDDASISSLNSTTSSVFSTSSRLSSRIPSSVKSSVKYLVRRNKNNPPADPNSKSFASKLLSKRSTLINFSLFSNKKQDVLPTNSTSTATLTCRTSGGQLDSLLSNKRRNSTAVVSLVSNSSSSHLALTADQPKNNDVGNLLFGKQVDDLDCMLTTSSDSKSEKIMMSKSSKKRELPWARQRAKSCQEDKTPMLRQLATKGSFHQLMMDLPNTNKAIPTDLPLFKGLVTTTLTTLHTRLMNECDRSLSTFILASNTPAFQTKTNIPQQLISIISDIYKMLEMVKWEDMNRKNKYLEIKEDMQQLERTILNEELTIISIKDIVSTMKQVLNECICQYYKVAEKAIVIPSKGYKIEGMNQYYNFDSIDQQDTNETASSTNTFIDHQDAEAIWYRTYFANQTKVCTFFGYNLHNEPLLISVKPEEEQRCRIIYRTKSDPDQRMLITEDSLPSSGTCIDDTIWKKIIESNIPEVSFQRLLKMDQEQMMSNGIQDEVLRLDESSLHTKYKFGVLLIKEGQTKEEEWFSNDGHDSEAFNELLIIIGRKVQLKDYTGWAAGLDTKSGDSGEHTYINVWNDHTIAYHVSTLIPSKPGDKQQIQRKRHIGNDIVCIVFVEGNQPFNPTAIKSQFLHVFIVVHQETCPNDDRKAWRVEVVYVEDVPSFGPPLPNKSALFFDKNELEEFLLAKLVNAEYAAFKSPKFALPMNRAREGIFSNLVEKGYQMLLKENQKNSDTVIEVENNSLALVSSSSSTTLLQQQQTSTESNKKPFRNHVRSASANSSITSSPASTSQFNGMITPSSSKANIIRELSGNFLVGLSRRRSIQGLTVLVEDDKNASSSSKGKKSSAATTRKFAEGSKRSRSEQDLMNMKLDNTKTNSFRHRAQNILTSIPGFSYSNSSNSSQPIRRLSLSN